MLACTSHRDRAAIIQVKASVYPRVPASEFSLSILFLISFFFLTTAYLTWLDLDGTWPGPGGKTKFGEEGAASRPLQSLDTGVFLGGSLGGCIPFIS